MTDIHIFLKPKRRYQGSKRYPRNKGERQFGGPSANAARAEGIRKAWDDPLRRAVMSRLKS
jgi:hypothetical protein